MSLSRYVGHIQHLRDRLWMPGVHGRAAVLIGAGFSRNAKPVYADAPQFALLNNYVEVFAKALGRDLNDAKFIPIDRLAEEYESSFGREALDDVIQRLIPWSSYRPGNLHRKLLQLPWADIFTTNYDSLLEDARSLVPHRRYDLVVHPDDLPTAQRPRIMKLHGSFPSARPFIFTEEDFRQYPQRFAPFVNAVQQGMLENTLCLIGFQGDDPNFLRWAGWIRDELGPHRPLIYLVNILNLNDARRRYLEKRQIIPIDLGEILQFPTGTPISEQFRIANEWFLDSLQNGRSEDPLAWPEVAKVSTTAICSPPPLEPRRTRVRTLTTSYNYTPEQLYLYWLERRETYPRWEIYPATNHQKLEHSPFHGEYSAFQSVQALSAPLDLLLLRELVWRETIQNAPLEPQLLKLVVQKLDSYAPFETGRPAPDGQLTPENTPKLNIPAAWTNEAKDRDLTWTEVRKIWLELAFAVLASYRMFTEVEEFNSWAELLRGHGHIEHFEEWDAQWHWEQVRQAIDLLDLNMAEARLKAWPSKLENPFWEIRRAAAMGEVGLITEARAVFRGALEQLRAGVRPGQPNPRLLSQLAWALRLRWFLNDWEDKQFPEEEEELADKEGLWRMGVDPWADIRHWKTELTNNYQKISNQAQKLDFRRQFDFGKATRSYSLNIDRNVNGNPLLAVKFLRFLEWAAYPLQVGHRVFGNEELQPALLLLSHPLTYAKAVLVAIRINDKNTLNGLMNRERLAGLPTAHLNFLIETLFTSINGAIPKARNANGNLRNDEYRLLNNILSLGVEALSRLLLRATTDQVRLALDMALELASLPAISHERDFIDSLSSLTSRTLDRWPAQEAEALVARLADFPIQQADRDADRWPRPLWHSLFNEVKRDGGTRLVPSSTVEKLTGLVASGDDGQRFQASLTLFRLFEMSALSKKEGEHYGDALWQKVDENTGMPTETGLMDFAVLSIPTSKRNFASESFKRYFTEGIFFDQPLNSNVIFGPGGGDELVDRALTNLLASNEILDDGKKPLIGWQEKEIKLLFLNLKSWWPKWEKYINDRRESVFLRDEGLETINRKILDVLHKVILPRIPEEEKSAVQFSQVIQQRMLEWGFTLSPEIRSDEYEAIETVIGRILSNRDELMATAIKDSVHLLVKGKSQELEVLRRLLVSRIIDRASPGLDIILRALSHLMDRHVRILTPDEIPLVLTSLIYLADETELDHQYSPILVSEARTARSEVRAEASSFVASLLRNASFLGFGDGKLEQEETIQRWRSIGEADPLPEVRKPWAEIFAASKGGQGKEKDELHS